MLEEFCQAPLSLELDLDTYEGDLRHVARFRGRSGWLMAARATLESETDIYRTVIAAACDEWDNPIPSFQATHLLECVWTKVHPCFDEPPAVLEDLLCEEEGQVYSRWQRETNAALQQHLIESEDRIARVERSARLASDARLRQIADVRRRRRFPGLTSEAKSIFDGIIAELETENDRAFEASRAQVTELRQTAETAEEGLWRREDVLVDVQRVCCVRWHTRPGLGQKVQIRTPVFQEEIYSALAIQSLQAAAIQEARWRREYERWQETMRLERNARSRERRARRKSIEETDPPLPERQIRTAPIE